MAHIKPFILGVGIGGAAIHYLPKPKILSSGVVFKSEEPPGETKSLKKEVFDIGSSMIQNFSPLNKIKAYFMGYHFYNGNMKRCVEAHHFCSHLNNDVHQCVIYDGNGPNAKLIGVEYIISRDLFNKLPEEEKKYWHSHVYEVKSGLLIAPGIPKHAEKSLMKDYVNTYGKTIHLWQVDRGDELPYGPPQLMMAYTADGQIDQNIIDKRDQIYGVNTSEIRKEREDLEELPVIEGANPWTKGYNFQFKAE